MGCHDSELYKDQILIDKSRVSKDNSRMVVTMSLGDATIIFCFCTSLLNTLCKRVPTKSMTPILQVAQYSTPGVILGHHLDK